MNAAINGTWNDEDRTRILAAIFEELSLDWPMFSQKDHYEIKLLGIIRDNKVKAAQHDQLTEALEKFIRRHA